MDTAAHLRLVRFVRVKIKLTIARRRGTGARSGSSVKKVAYLPRTPATNHRPPEIVDQYSNRNQPHPPTVNLMNAMIYAGGGSNTAPATRVKAVSECWHAVLRKIKAIMAHYITRNRSEYFKMFYSAAGGGVVLLL